MTADIHAIADEVFGIIDTGRQTSTFTSRVAGLTLDDGYRVAALLKEYADGISAKSTN